MRWSSLAPHFHALLRIMCGLLFIPIGTMKLFGWPMPMPGGATAHVLSQVWIGGVLELLGGVLLVVGFCTRPVAFVLSGEMAVAYFQFHAPQGFWPMMNMGQPAILFCFIYLYLSTAGAGPWSVDSAMSRRSAPAMRGSSLSH